MNWLLRFVNEHIVLMAYGAIVSITMLLVFLLLDAWRQGWKAALHDFARWFFNGEHNGYY